jgi:hypothetical protein
MSKADFLDLIGRDDPWCIGIISKLEQGESSKQAFPSVAQVTCPGQQFFDELHKTIEIMMLLAQSITFADNAQFVSKHLINRLKNHPPDDLGTEAASLQDFDPFWPISQTPGPFQRRYQKIIEVLEQMLIVRLCDNFTTYISEIVRECVEKNPNILKSK